MYIHLGEDVVIRASDVVAILEWQPSDEIYEYIEHFKEANKLVDFSGHDTKSLVVTSEKFIYHRYHH